MVVNEMIVNEMIVNEMIVFGLQSGWDKRGVLRRKVARTKRAAWRCVGWRCETGGPCCGCAGGGTSAEEVRKQPSRVGPRRPNMRVDRSFL